MEKEQQTIYKIYVRKHAQDKELALETSTDLLLNGAFNGAMVDPSVLLVELYRFGRLEGRVDKSLPRMNRQDRHA